MPQFLELREVSDPYSGKETKTAFQKNFRRKGLTLMTGDMNIIQYVHLITSIFQEELSNLNFLYLLQKYSMNVIVAVKLLALTNVLCFQVDVTCKQSQLPY